LTGSLGVQIVEPLVFFINSGAKQAVVFLMSQEE